jgi:hypothetical protein
MSKAIPVTRQELVRAWRHLHQAARVTSRQAPHRLLVFYAVECGLKAVWLRRQAKEVLEGADIEHLGHDLNQLFKELHVGRSLSALPACVTLKPLGKPPRMRVRSGGVEVLHQAWRYGIEVQTPDDTLMEVQLDGLNAWIAKELQ